MIAERPAQTVPVRPAAGRCSGLLAWLPDLAGLGAVWAFEAWLLAVWLAIDTRPPNGDPAFYLQMTEAWRRFFLAPSLDSLSAAATFATWKTTPLWLIIMGLAQAVLGPDIDRTVWLSSSLALAILLLATYGIGRTLFGRVPGLCAAALVTLYTGVVIQSHVYLLDLPLTAMVALAAFGLARLLRPRIQRRDIVLAALLLGLACCTKYQAPFFLWLPALFVLGWRWRAERARGASPAQALRHVIVLAAAFGVGVLLVVGPFLAADPASFGRGLAAFSQQASFESYGGWLPYDGAALTLYSLGWSVRTWFAFAWGDQWLLLVLPVVGAAVVLLRLRAAAGLLLGWYLGAFWPLWHMIDKEPRYDLPLYPAFALLSVSPLALLASLPALARLCQAGSATLLCALGLYGLSTLAWHAFGLDSPLQVVHLPGAARSEPPPPINGRVTVWQHLARPAAENWQDAAITALLARTRHALGLPRLVVAFVPMANFFQVETFRYRAMLADEPITFVTDAWDPASDYSRGQLFGADLVVTKTGEPGVPRDSLPGLPAFARALADPSTDLGAEVARQFTLLARLPLPDGSEALLYARNSLLASWSALESWPTARVESPLPDAAHPLAGPDGRLQAVGLGGSYRRALFEHPPAVQAMTRVSYTLPALPEHAALELGVGLLPDAWQGAGDGVEFRVVANADGQDEVLFDQYVDPKHDPAARRWLDARLDLSRYAGRAIQLRFETGPGPAGDNTADWAVWSEPILLPLDPARLGAFHS